MRGQKFKIKSPTVAIDRLDQHTKLIPTGVSGKVVDEPSGTNPSGHG